MPSLLDDLGTLIAFPTVSSRPNEALVAWLAERSEHLGMRVERFQGSEPGKLTVVAAMGPQGTDGLVLTGHTDVVPTEGQPWTSDPFRLTEHDGRLVGRGTADMKGFIAACLQALGSFRADQLTREVVCVWTHDEEVGCHGAGELVDAWPERPLPSACWVGEPTSRQVMRMHAGHVALEIVVRGKAAHSSRPSLGDNAIERAAAVIGLVQQLAAELARERMDLPMDDPTVPLVLVGIEGGTAINIVPDRVALRLGYRPLPGMPALAVFERLRDRLDLRFGGAVEAMLGTVTPALLTADHTPLARLFAAHAQPGPAVAPFATDGGQLSRLGTMPLVFGPGSIDVAHQADEHVDAHELHAFVPVIERVIAARCVRP